MRINLSRVVMNPDKIQSFEVHRNTGDWTEKGRWSQTEQVLMLVGVVSPLNEKDLAQLPEGDRVKQAMKFHTTSPLYVTRDEEGSKGTSDLIKWHDSYYRIQSIGDYGDYGYYSAIGVKIEGK